MVLEASGSPVSPFYNYMNKLRQDVPVASAFNLYKTADGSVHKYTDETPVKAKVETYLDLVYNNAGNGANRIQKLFDAEK